MMDFGEINSILYCQPLPPFDSLKLAALTQTNLLLQVGTFCRCKHPSLVKYYGLVANRPELNFWLVTELVTGHSLARLVADPELKSLYGLKRRERLEMSACLAAAVQYLHKVSYS